MKRIFLLIVALCAILFADVSDKAIEAYNNGDYTEAIEYFEEAASKDIMAQHWLAIMYEKGQGTNVDYQKALYWHKKAANNGHAISQFILAENILFANNRYIGIKNQQHKVIPWHNINLHSYT
ncbi:tetratricopeptide repeat protein [Poseidonibacter ostreae]|uniref:beta-lactamase n=1 Tax=Poseidonibacter ostreae TaxID=2654171 RepID=A0A6L4WNC6_9BACT|nr:SEL1-like repeat protein [Poseidonibacter ostreae]KAB7883032.1 hypothetical protein GA417_13345 [Poseidonibacter ostreae]KAB7884919.1 hypothetical protein GBG19_15140 [Poseidonibacter ostreae]KAB7887401.1 hypothetical protein GBG18_14035 [Poseidonibacter ostreae]